MIKPHVGQLVSVIGNPGLTGRIAEFIGQNWVMIKPSSGGWPKCVMISEIIAVSEDQTENELEAVDHR